MVVILRLRLPFRIGRLKLLSARLTRRRHPRLPLRLFRLIRLIP